MGLFGSISRLISPKRAYNRAATAAAVQVLHRYTAQYDAEGRNSRMGWRNFSNASPATQVSKSITRLRAVSRDMRRNNAYAARAIAALASNVVGEGIIPAVQGTDRTKIRIQELIKAHFDTTAIDFDGRHNLYGLQSLAMATMAEAGECLIIRRRATASAGLRLPFQIQVIEPDLLVVDNDRTLPGGGVVISGVEFNASGQRVAYHLYKSHPGSEYATGETVQMPAEDVIHLFRCDRPGQVRGVPWLSPVMVKLWDLALYEQAELVKQEIAACFAAFVIDHDGESGVEARARAESEPEIQVDQPAASPRESLEAGTITYLKPGSQVTFGSPPQPQSYEAFVRAHIRTVAAGLGMPAEVLSGDLSQVNFSSGRMGWLEFQRVIDQWRWHVMIPHLCEGVGRWFAEAVSLTNPRLSGWSLGWTPPRREMIQPKEEVEADIAEIRAGLASRSEKLRKRGYDPEDVDREIAEDNARADRDGLSFDTDGRRPRTGPIQPQNQVQQA